MRSSILKTLIMGHNLPDSILKISNTHLTNTLCLLKLKINISLMNLLILGAYHLAIHGGTMVCIWSSNELD